MRTHWMDYYHQNQTHSFIVLVLLTPHPMASLLHIISFNHIIVFLVALCLTASGDCTLSESATVFKDITLQPSSLSWNCNGHCGSSCVKDTIIAAHLSHLKLVYSDNLMLAVSLASQCGSLCLVLMKCRASCECRGWCGVSALTLYVCTRVTRVPIEESSEGSCHYDSTGPEEHA